MNILVVEDESTDFILIRHAIASQDPEIRILHGKNCQDARAIMAETRVDIAIVDLLLPDGDGYILAEELHAARIPYVIVSSRSHAENVVQGLRGGAEDYIRKPFDPEEFTIRFEKVLARCVCPVTEILRQETDGEAIVAGHRVILTPIEEKILFLLHERFDEYIPSEELIASVWGDTCPQSSKGALRTYMSHIRKKITETGADLSILSKWGRGYRLTTQAES